MASQRTTVSLEPGVYDTARANFRRLGFTRLGDLINVALRDYLQRQQIQEKLRMLEEAAGDTEYLGLIREIGEQVAFMDADGLPGDY